MSTGNSAADKSAAVHTGMRTFPMRASATPTGSRNSSPLLEPEANPTANPGRTINPMHMVAPEEDEEQQQGSGELSGPEDRAALEWDDDMLQDLVFAFEACDVDHNGTLTAEELLVVMRVLRANGAVAQQLGIAEMEQLITEERAEWQKLQSSAKGSASNAAAVLLQRQQKLLEKAASQTSGLAKRVHAGAVVAGVSKLGHGVERAAHGASSGVSKLGHGASSVGHTGATLPLPCVFTAFVSNSCFPLRNFSQPQRRSCWAQRLLK